MLYLGISSFLLKLCNIVSYCILVGYVSLEQEGEIFLFLSMQ